MHCIKPYASTCARAMQLRSWSRPLQRRNFCRCRAQGADKSAYQQQQEDASDEMSKEQLAKQAIAMYAAGATLGPFCDSLHSQGDVLHYAQPTITSLGPVPLETCWWVPLLFGVAGLILGVSYPVLDVLDQRHNGKQQQRQATSLEPSWATTLLCISLFVAQYKLSAVLDQAFHGQPGVADVILLAYGLALWRGLDNTAQGFAMSLLTAVAGPAVEVFLINALGLYHYEHPLVLGVPTWIPWVYFCGGPAVGLLGRKVWATLKAQGRAAS